MFFQGFLKHPSMVGSVIPSFPTLVNRMLAPVDWSQVKLFVEYGPGVGTFTRTILDRLRPDAELIAIDTNEDFVRYLARDIADSRLKAVHGSAADVRDIIAELGGGQADFILSGLPFSTLPPGVGADIAAATEAALRPGGAFLVYQLSSKARDFIAPHFARIEDGMEFWNIPPLRLHWAWKAED
jgi:phospholipid N-methyltransferase